MTSSNGNIIALLAICVGNSPVTGEFPARKPVTRDLMFSLICVWINGWVNNGEAGDLRRRSAHYDVTVMDNNDSTLFTVRAERSQTSHTKWKRVAEHGWFYYTEVTWAPLRVNSPATPLSVLPFVQAHIRKNIKAPRHCFFRGSTGDPWIPLTKGQ